MLFGLGRKQDNQPSDKLSRRLTDYLNKVDEEYMKAFAIKSTRALQVYMTRECALKVGQAVFSMGSRYFGAEKFRQTAWVVVEETGDVMTVSKDVLFDKVKIGGAMQIGVADNYVEYWDIDTSSISKPIVIDIRKHR